MAQFETQHENPQLEQVIRDLTWRVVQQKLGNLDEVENRDELNEEFKADKKQILNSPTFKDWIIPELKAAIDAGTPYKVISYYKNEDPNAPYNGFMLKAPASSKFENIEVNLETDLEDIYGYNLNVDISDSIASEGTKLVEKKLPSLDLSPAVQDNLKLLLNLSDDPEARRKLHEVAKEQTDELIGNGTITDDMMENFAKTDPTNSPHDTAVVLIQQYNNLERNGKTQLSKEDFLQTVSELISDIEINGNANPDPETDPENYKKLMKVKAFYDLGQVVSDNVLEADRVDTVEKMNLPHETVGPDNE